jgi:hypothetical protein
MFQEGTQTTSYLLSFLDLDLYSVIKRVEDRLGYYTCYFDPLRSPGKPPLWWTSFITKMREVLTKVTVVGSSIVMQDLGYLWWDLHKYKSCDNILAPLPRSIESFSSMNHILVSFLLKPYLTSLPGDSSEGSSITFF